MGLWTTLQIALGAGLATTFDDTIYLTGFFGEVNRTFRPKHVAVGELLGFTALLAISLIGYALGLALPAQAVGLLGVLPILIGVKNLVQLLGQARQSQDRRAIAAKGSAKAKGFEPRRLSLWQVLRDRQTYDVSLVTISNGSNNLTIYIPLFASLSVVKILVVIPVLYAFILTWLFLSFALTRMPGLALVLNRYARTFFPFILIWLGFRILNDTGAMAWLLSAWPAI